ncbi:MAG: FAD-dependent oxidoreductase [Dehalococcoidia bacterium]|jgi:NADPH-dependent 2,4-dienoyl-CoA reductase/sulfur reductase-like enzyme
MDRQAKRLLVIGGGAAGMSAAAAARRRQPDAEIVVIERGPRVSFMLCGLPYFISDVVKDEESLVVYEADYFRTERQIDVRTGCEVKGIDAQDHNVECIDVATREKEVLGYKKLVIAAGAQPILPGIRGLDLRGVFGLRTLDSAIAVKQFIAQRPVKRAAIIGAGYIGLEMAEALTTAGAATTIIEASDTVLPMSEPEIGELIEEELRRHGVELLKPRLALSFEGASATVERVATDGGDVEVEMVLIAAGARPDSAVAREAGVALGEIGGIATDEMMRTNVPDIYAAGDCVESRNLLTGKTIFLPLGTTANKQGRVAGDNAMGGRATFPGIMTTLAFKVFDLEVARTGLSHDQARSAGFAPVSAIIRFPSRSPFYPRAETLTVKLIADERTGRLLGAQMAGHGTVAKRIDVVAAALHAKMTVSDLMQLDLTHAPPFANEWEGIQLAAQAIAHHKARSASTPSARPVR